MKKVNKIGSKTRMLWQNPEFRKMMVEARNRRGFQKYGFNVKTSTLYSVFSNMKRRCGNKKDAYYPRYGGRGIKVLWPNFGEFYRDMGASYEAHKANNSYTSIDRIDNDGPYSKENCRWATRSEQNKNKRFPDFCKHGHPLFTAIKKNGEPTRYCKMCKSIKGAKRYLLIKASLQDKKIV